MPERALYLIFTGRPIGALKRFETPHIRVANWLTQKFTGSELMHVSISDGTYVLSSGIPGREYFLAEQFARNPNIKTIVELEWLQPFELDGYGRDKQAWILMSLAKGLSRGLIETNDCLCVVKKVLAAAGYDVPRRIWSPRLLLEWCANNANINIRQGRDWFTGFSD